MTDGDIPTRLDRIEAQQRDLDERLLIVEALLGRKRPLTAALPDG